LNTIPVSDNCAGSAPPAPPLRVGAKSFHGERVEVDAVPADILRELERQQHLDHEESTRLEEIKRGEKETLERMLRVLEPAS